MMDEVKQAKIIKEVKRVTGCTYLMRAQMLLVPGTGARLKWKIPSPFTRYSPFLDKQIRSNIWTWNGSLICRIWERWAWVKVSQITQQIKKT